MRGTLYDVVSPGSETVLRRVLWIPDESVLVTVVSDDNQQTEPAQHLPGDLRRYRKVEDIGVPHSVVLAIRHDLKQRRAREEHYQLLIKSAEECEKQLKKALRPLKLLSRRRPK